MMLILDVHDKCCYCFWLLKDQREMTPKHFLICFVLAITCNRKYVQISVIFRFPQVMFVC